MLDTQKFGDYLQSVGLRDFVGVPCSYLAPLINYAINSKRFIMSNNEGDSVAIASGISLCRGLDSSNTDSKAEGFFDDFTCCADLSVRSYLMGSAEARKSNSSKSTKKPTPCNYGVVLMQNSGLSNALSPLTSLNYTFKIPILGFVSLRGERDSSGKNTDEPQHELLGIITDKLLETCEMKYAFLDSDMDRAKVQVQEALGWLEKGESFFFIVRDKTFSKVSLVSGHSACGNSSLGSHSGDFVDFRVSDTIANADSMSSSPLKSTKSLTSNTALVRSTSPYLQNTRIVDSAIAESQVDSRLCHTEQSEVSTSLESQADSNNTESKPDSKPTQPANKMPTRLEALKVLHALAKDSKALLLATTGKCGRELYEIEDSPNQLYMVGSMGCVSSLSLGIALKSRQKVIAIDGDSALLMRLGALSTNAYYTRNRDNFCHILLDNESHDSTGGQFNLSPFVDFSSITKSCGYVNVYIAESLEEFELHIKAFLTYGNSSLGSHSSDFVDFRRTADSMSSSPLKSTKSPTSTTANTRIVDSSIAESQTDSNNTKSKNANPSNLDSKKGAWFIYLKIQKGSKENLGRPKVTPQEVAQRLSEYMRGN